MRVKVELEADVSSLPWEDVHGPARGVVYALLRSQDEGLARKLHEEGWRGQPLKPLGVTSPQFEGAPKRKGVYATSSDGSVWFGSPVPEIAEVLLASLHSRQEIRWGTVRLRVRGTSIDAAYQAADGYVELSTVTPVVIKHEGHFLLPGDPHYTDRLQHNLERKADVLGHPRPHGLRVLTAGPRRRFTVRGAPRIGAWVRVGMEADAGYIGALRSWGMGLDTMQGFGWIR